MDDTDFKDIFEDDENDSADGFVDDFNFKTTYFHSNGAHQEDYDHILRKYVPKRGHCCNDVFELFRLMRYVYNKFYKNGKSVMDIYMKDYSRFQFQSKDFYDMLVYIFEDYVMDDVKPLEVVMDATVIFAKMSEAQGDITLPAKKFFDVLNIPSNGVVWSPSA